MLLGERLVVKLGAVDGLATSAIALGKVTTLQFSNVLLASCASQDVVIHFARARATAYLDHELLDDAVEDGALVVQRLARLADALLTSAEGAEVLGRLGDEVRVELHGHAASGLAADRDVKEDAGTVSLVASHFKWCLRSVLGVFGWEGLCEWDADDEEERRKLSGWQGKVFGACANVVARG